MAKQYPRLVGITGAAGSGKDVAANFLQTRFNFYQYKLAQPIKDGICAMFGLEPSVWESDEKEWLVPGLPASPRMMAQTLGTEWGRELITPEIWVRQLQREWYNILQDGAHVRGGNGPALVVSDVRFDNEAHWITDRGGVVIRIDRPLATNVRAHVSEEGVSEAYIDSVIDNDCDIIEFLQRFDDKLSSLACTGGVDIEWVE